MHCTLHATCDGFSHDLQFSALFFIDCSTIKCGCHWPVQPCALCTGRVDPTAPRDLPDTLATAERVALLDPGFHPVLSFPDGENFEIEIFDTEMKSNPLSMQHCRRLQQHSPRSHHEYTRMAVKDVKVITEDHHEACHT